MATTAQTTVSPPESCIYVNCSGQIESANVSLFCFLNIVNYLNIFIYLLSNIVWWCIFGFSGWIVL